MSVRTARLALVSLLLLAPFTLASESGQPDAWKGSVDAGYTSSGGNSNSSTLTGAMTGKKTSGKFTHHIETRGKNTAESNLRTGESYRVSGKEDIALGAANYLFVTGAWEKDRFNGLEWQATAAAGYGHKLIDSASQQLSLEAGPGYRHDELVAGNDDSAVFYAAADYNWKVSENTQFTQRLTAEDGETNTITRSLSELAVKMNSRLALKLKLEIRRVDEPLPGTKNSDRTTTVALAWSY